MSRASLAVAALGSVAALAGCGPKAPAVSTPAAPNVELPARWALIPAPAPSADRSGHTYLYAWRLDTKQGDVELCVFDSDPPTFNGKPFPQLTCSNRDEAVGREQ